MPSFQEILKTKAKDVERPEPYPIGTYLCVVGGLPKLAETGDNKAKTANFQLKIIAPQEDVDPESVASYTTKFGALQGKIIPHNIFLENQDGGSNLWRLKQFLVEHLDIEEGNKGLDEMINETPNRQVLVKGGHQPSKTGDAVYFRVESTFKV